MDEKKLLGMLGLTARAGKLIFGQSRCLEGIRDGTLALVLLDGDAAGNTRQAVERACRHHGVPLTVLAGADVLGSAVGRPAVRVVGVKDRLFAQQLCSSNGTGTEV